MATADCVGFDALLDRLLSEIRMELSRKHLLDMEGLAKKIEMVAQSVDLEASPRDPHDIRIETKHSMLAPNETDDDFPPQTSENGIKSGRLDELQIRAASSAATPNSLSHGPRGQSIRSSAVRNSRSSRRRRITGHAEGMEPKSTDTVQLYTSTERTSSRHSDKHNVRLSGDIPEGRSSRVSQGGPVGSSSVTAGDSDKLQLHGSDARSGRKRSWQSLLEPNRPDATSRVCWDVWMCAVMALLILVETTSFAIPECQEGTFADFWGFFLLAVFTADMMICFNTSLVLIVGRKVVVISDRVEIAKAYCKGWFIVDVVSTFPFDMVLEGVVSASNSRMLKMGKVLRMARLVKGFLKIMKLMQHWGEIQDRIQEKVLDLIGCQGYQIDKAALYVSRAWALVLVLLTEAHVFACALLLLTRHTEGMSWSNNGVDIHDLEPFSRYIAALRNLVYIVLTGTIDPEILGFGDTIVTMLILWFYVQLNVVVAIFVGIKTDPGLSDGDFSIKCSRLRRYLRHHSVIKRVRDEVDSHLSKVGKYVGMNLDSLLDELPSTIRQSVSAGLYYPFYNNMAFFMQDSISHEGFEYDICAEIESLFYRPHDKIVCMGSALQGLHYLAEGYGEITRILPNEGEQEIEWTPQTYLFLEGLFAPKPFTPATGEAEAIEPCEVWFLSRSAFDKLLQETDPLFRTTVETVRSKVSFNDELHSWVMEITEDEGDVQHFALDYLVDDGIHPTFRHEASVSANVSRVSNSGSDDDLPPGKRFHYFLSHRKLHSKLGNRPELIAQSLHDALSARGFTGFFDVDDLVEISQTSLEQAVQTSCGMIVILNDETAGSEWCRLEWECAAAHGIPVKCVVDSQHCHKADLLEDIRNVNAALLEYQWSEYLDRYRKSVAKDLAEWLGTILNLQPRQLNSVEPTGSLSQTHADTDSRASLQPASSLPGKSGSLPVTTPQYACISDPPDIIL